MPISHNHKTALILYPFRLQNKIELIGGPKQAPAGTMITPQVGKHEDICKQSAR